MTSAKKLSVTEFPTYEEYKDSGVEWLGEVPKEWEVTRLKNFSKIFNGATPSSSTEIFWDGGITWVTPVDIDGSMYVYQSKRTISRAGYSSCGTTLVPENSVIITCRAPIGKVALAGNKLCTNQGCKSLVISKDVEHKFVYYYFSISQRLLNSFGSGTTFLELSSEALKNFMVCLPSYKEQTLIAQFLDQKTALIDQAIAIKEQQIKLLNERKQIIIQQAVTQGLNPNAPMKNSGVEWIGQIPEHWGVSLGFTVYKEVRDSNKGLIENKVLSLSYGQIIIRPESKMFGLMPESFETYQIVQPDDIIIRCTDLQNDKTSLRTGIVKNKGIITSAYLNIRAKEKLLPSYLHYFFHVLDITKAIYKFGSGLRQNLSFNDFRRMNIATPPLEEQKKIVAFIKNSSNRATEIIALHNQQIQALKEYKTTLINSAVTGKIKITQAMLTEVKEVGYAE
ncbi:MAG: restriction endonuclease subunit S [Trichlorobacter sp.]|jgi:type I restriction enzyme S subunit|nr:restriction endonuclease subunit S [Trichlorobacter sp.]